MSADHTAQPLDVDEFLELVGRYGDARARAVDPRTPDYTAADFDVQAAELFDAVRAKLLTEVERLHELRDAAIVWRRQFEKPVKLPRMAALIAAVDALNTAGTAPAAGGEAAR